MVDATIPAIPVSDAPVLAEPVNSQSPINPVTNLPLANQMSQFVLSWYLFFRNVRSFLAAVRNAPKQIAQPDLAAYTRKLTNLNAGIQIWIPAPYQHLIRWNGTAWEFWPGDASAYYVDGLATPPSPVGWHLADGSTVTYLKGDGTTATATLTTTANRWFRL